jgi:SET domain.
MKLAPSILIVLSTTSSTLAFSPGSPSTCHHARLTPSTSSLLGAKKTKGKKTTSASSGLKGFGSTTKSSTTSTINVPIDRSNAAMDFYTFLENNGAGANLKRVALGFFPFTPDGEENKLRGVVALKKIPKGEVIIEIPYEAAFNLGMESNDPTLPGSILLQEYCQWISGAEASKMKKRDLGPYLQVLPPFGTDELGSTDFFSDEALDMLQSPQIKEETLARRDKSLARFERDVKPMSQIGTNMYKWANNEEITEEHLRWASWIVTSRVLTVQGEAGSGEAYRLMIPLIDMCNHDRDSPHILTGRAVPGGTLKVVAGKTVDVGEQINIVYGGGVSGNDRFVQDYGFLDTLCNGAADDITAKILMGRGRILEGAGAKNGRPTLMPEDERERALAALDETTLEEDLGLMSTRGKDMPNDVRSALEYRIGIKKALKKLGYGLVMDG